MFDTVPIASNIGFTPFRVNLVDTPIRHTRRMLVTISFFGVRLFEWPKPPREPFAASTLMLRNMLIDCPGCKLSLQGHSWATLAEAGNESDIKRLPDLVRSRNLGELSEIKSFDGMKDAIIAAAVSCPEVHGGTLWYVDYHELWANEAFGEFYRHDQQQWSELLQCFPKLAWHPF
jgi:hypothetical protein